MDNSRTTTLASTKYVEAETVSEDSEISSLSNFTDAASEVNPFLDGINKVKDLIQELEESFRESNTVGNNLILRCVMLRAENQNLNHQIDERNRHISTTLHNKHWQFSVLTEDKSKLMYKGLTRDETKRIACAIQSGGNFHQRLGLNTDSETDLLYKTLEDLQKKLKEKDKKIESLYQKHLHLIADKSKMENDLRSKVLSLEKQLDAAYETLTEFQAEVEGMMNKSLSSTKNTHEALFLQEKLRCSKLMYENLRLHHQIKRLEDNIRRKSSAPDDEEESFRVKSSVDKCPSEPLMKHF